PDRPRLAHVEGDRRAPPGRRDDGARERARRGEARDRPGRGSRPRTHRDRFLSATGGPRWSGRLGASAWPARVVYSSSVSDDEASEVAVLCGGLRQAEASELLLALLPARLAAGPRPPPP